MPKPAQAPPRPRTRARRSPLADLRALGGSTVFHALVLLAGSLTVLAVALPDDREASRAIEGSLGPIDNRAAAKPGGGGPGELGGLGDTPSREGEAGEALSARATVDLPRWLRPAGSSRGVGTLPGAGTGGGGGTGGGSGGGLGTGAGPGTEFFGTRETATSFVYVIDRSGSMANRNSLGVAKRELLASIDQLADDCRFAVVLYDTKAEFVDGPAMDAASADRKARLHAKLATIRPDGGTDHKTALMAALRLSPEVIFFLTDADLMTDNEAEEIRRSAGPSRIQAIEFGVGPDVGASAPLRRLASGTGGSYRYIDVTTFR